MPNILVTNARSIVQKVDELQSVFENNNVHIACITESWLNDCVPSCLVNIDGYVCYRRDRRDGRRGGGVVCYVRNDVQCQRLSEFNCDDVESLWLIFRASRMPRLVSHVVFGVIYYPPNADSASTLSHIIGCLDNITQKHPQAGIILCGDFNQLNDRALLSYPLKQIVRLATRRNNILDKIYTNIDNYFHTPCILPPIGESDHNVVFIQAINIVHNHAAYDRVSFVKVRSTDSTGKTLLAHSLSRYNWSTMYIMNDCDQMLDYFNWTIYNLLNEFLPLRISRRYSTEKPWVSDSFRRLIRQRQYAWQQQDMVKYRRLRNLVQRTAKELHRNYYNKCVSSLRVAGSRHWWKAVKHITGQSQQNPLHNLAHNLYRGDFQKLATDINSFFSSVSADLETFQSILVPDTCESFPEKFVIEPYSVERKLALIDPHKACGPDDVPNWVWRDYAPWLAEPVCAIFNLSLRHGIVPRTWKLANVVPIPKTIPPTRIDKDLRPISLTPTLSKVLESFVGQWILDELKGKLDPRQYGALRGKSTTHELVDILHHWHQALDDHSSVRTVFVDYAKAFDHVDHSIVIRKLLNLGVSSTLVRWVCSFLCDRQQRVKISDCVSEWLTLRGGMPQGSYLGPLIFLVLINDLTAGCLLHKFVDDTTLSEIILKDSTSNMSKIFSEVINWSQTNLMNINWSKTKEMVLGSSSFAFKSDVLICDHAVERVKVFKLLGVTIDDKLRWNAHVDSICAKASSRLHFLKRLKRSSVSTDDLLCFYNSAVRPILEYACPVWHNSLTQEQSHQIESIQKRAFRIIYGNTLLHYGEFCNSSGLTTLIDRRVELSMSFFNNCVLDVKSCLHYLLPEPRNECVAKLRRHVQYVPQTARTSRFNNSFLMYALNHYQTTV